MIVRDLGNSWQIVLQTDHADLSGAFARAWAEPGPRHDSLTLATVRHDDGWAIWERAPLVDGSGRPVDFLEVNVLVHLASYRACIAAVREQDRYAGLLNSMHGAGVYRKRYGRDPDLPTREEDPAVTEQIEAFVAEQEASWDALLAETRVDGDQHWRDYELLELYDRLSLYFCMRDAEHGEPQPTELQGYRIEAAGPWRIRMTPYPFTDAPARFSLVRRVVPRSERPDVLASRPERVEIVIEP